MHRKAIVGMTAALASALVIVGAPFASAGPAVELPFGIGEGGLVAVGLTSNQRLVQFEVEHPEQGQLMPRITGLVGDVRLLGIDYRVANGLLYGVGNAGGIYTLDENTSVATKVAQLSVPLMGVNFGVDVNPVPDALRIISDRGQNLRFSFSAGTTTVDTTLTYPPATTPATGVTGAAYTNNDGNADTATTLYDLDTTMDQVAVQAPANSGQLSPTGKLTVDAGASAGFDIYSQLGEGGATVDNTGYAVLQVSGSNRVYEINLLTGKATDNGAFLNNVPVVDLALPLDQE